MADQYVRKLALTAIIIHETSRLIAARTLARSVRRSADDSVAPDRTQLKRRVRRVLAQRLRLLAEAVDLRSHARQQEPFDKDATTAGTP
jgi:hypothetical protein